LLKGKGASPGPEVPDFLQRSINHGYCPARSPKSCPVGTVSLGTALAQPDFRFDSSSPTDCQIANAALLPRPATGKRLRPEWTHSCRTDRAGGSIRTPPHRSHRPRAQPFSRLPHTFMPAEQAGFMKPQKIRNISSTRSFTFVKSELSSKLPAPNQRSRQPASSFVHRSKNITRRRTQCMSIES
jgi:hypothetical protein